MTIEATDPNCAWLTNFLEIILLQVWYPITVATLSREVRKIVTKAFDDMTSYDEATRDFLIDFVLNDFGFRASTSVQSARNGGSAHLINFRGSDTTMGSWGICNYYNTDTIYGLSVPATEHSIMTLYGREGEAKMMERVLDMYPTGIVACVSDTYHIFNACSNIWGGTLKEKILSRPAEPGNQLVIRPDSGPVIPTLVKVFDILFEKFGYTENEKGYKVLPPQVRVIQGDGINLDSIKEIYDMCREHKISPENFVLGMGGKLLQSEIDRDTQNFATKASNATIDGVDVDVVKSPTVLDAEGNLKESFKKSKQGRLKLVKTQTGYKTMTSLEEGFEEAEDCLELVFENGSLYNECTFEEVRERAKVTPEEVAQLAVA